MSFEKGMEHIRYRVERVKRVTFEGDIVWEDQIFGNVNYAKDYLAKQTDKAKMHIEHYVLGDNEKLGWVQRDKPIYYNHFTEEFYNK
jgi:hypothetical protein